MAVADALHCILVKPELACKDKTGLMGDIMVLHPKETGIMASKPGFHCMHQVISHVGISQCLDCWCVLAECKNSAHTTLEKLTESQPMFHELEDMAEDIIQEFASTKGLIFALTQANFGV